MAKFDTSQSVEQLVWQLRLADWPRSERRAWVSELFDGFPPYTALEQENNGIHTNVNDLSAAKIAGDARKQFDNAFISPDPLFNVDLDFGPQHKRQQWSMEITKWINKIIGRSSYYLDLRQGVFAGVVLHGVGPSNWDDAYKWCPVELGIEDVLIPSGTRRSMSNLTMFAVYRSFTYNQLLDLTSGPNVDPGWQMDVVKQALAWVDQQAVSLLGTTWPEVWSPEKMSERIKQDSGLYASDAIPTIDAYDFYFYSDEGGKTGWRRRMVLDAWGSPGVGGVPPMEAANNRRFDFSRGKFLYNSRDRIYRPKLDQILHFQFGDASAKSPFKYHSVRSLGWLLYDVCNLQNRLKCRFTDSVFESLLQYFRINNPADVDRLQKIDLVHLGILPEGLEMVKPEDRWKYDQALVTEAFNMNRQTMAEMASSFSQRDQDSSPEETATLTMAKATASNVLIGAMLNRAYEYEKARYFEICRRFCIKNSRDPDVKEFRVEVLKRGIPEEALDSNRWNILPNRVIGSGNKQLAIATTNALFEMRPVLNPEAQKQVDRMRIAVLTDNYPLAMQLVPDEPHISDSIHDTELAFGAMMTGAKVTPKPGLNPAEVAEKTIELMANKIAEIKQTSNVGTPQDLMGLMNAAQYAEAFIMQLAQDKNSKPLVKQLNDALKNLMNMLRAFAQRQQEAAQKQQAQNGGDPELAAKIQATVITAQAKAQNTRESHAQRTAQRQLQFEQQVKQDAQKHRLEMAKEAQKLQFDAAKSALDLQAQQQKNRIFDEE